MDSPSLPTSRALKSGALDLFPGPELELLVRAVEAGNAAAQVWTADDRWALLWDRCNNVLCLGGQVPEGHQPALRRLLTETIPAESRRVGREWLRAHGTTSGLTDLLAGMLVGQAPVRAQRRFYGFAAAAPSPGLLTPIPGVEVVPIDRNLLELVRPQNSEEIAAEIGAMWPSSEAFYRSGFGCAALANGAAVCWCTAEYLSGDRCGIGIATMPEQRRRGIATLVAARFVAESLGRGLTPHWDCAAGNIPSVRLAERLGFTLLTESDFLYWHL